MATRARIPQKTVDGLLKTLLVLSRTVAHTLETEAVKAAAKEPVSGSKVQILRLLGTRASQTSSQIARFLSVSKPAVTQLIDSMVRRKLVSRKTALHDRREVDLRLTDKGRRVYEAIRREQHHLVRSTVRGVSAAQAAKWSEALDSVTEALAQAGGTFEHFCLQCGAHADGSCVLSGGNAECLFLAREKEPRKRAKRATRRGAAGAKVTGRARARAKVAGGNSRRA